MARKKNGAATAGDDVRISYHPDGSVAAIEGPPSLVIKLQKQLRRPLRSAAAASSDLPSFFERVGPRRGEDVLTVAYFLNRRAGFPDVDRTELSHAIARCGGRKKKVNAATIYGLLEKGLLSKVRRGRYAITDEGAAVVERRAGGAVTGRGGADLRGLEAWLGTVKRLRGTLIPTFAFYLETVAGLAAATRSDLCDCYVALGKDRSVAPATLARLVRDGVFERAERGRYRLTTSGRKLVEDLVGQVQGRRKRGPRRRRGPERLEVPELRGSSSFLNAFDLGQTMHGRAWKLALAAGYFLEKRAVPALKAWKRGHLEAVFNRARGMEAPGHLSVLLTGKLAKDGLVARAGRRGYFALTKGGRELVESQPNFAEAMAGV